MNVKLLHIVNYSLTLFYWLMAYFDWSIYTVGDFPLQQGWVPCKFTILGGWTFHTFTVLGKKIITSDRHVYYFFKTCNNYKANEDLWEISKIFSSQSDHLQLAMNVNLRHWYRLSRRITVHDMDSPDCTEQLGWAGVQCKCDTQLDSERELLQCEDIQCR